MNQFSEEDIARHKADTRAQRQATLLVLQSQRKELKEKQAQLSRDLTKKIASLGSRMSTLSETRGRLNESIEAGKLEVTAAFVAGTEKSVATLRARLKIEASDVEELGLAIDSVRSERDRLRNKLQSVASDLDNVERHIVQVQMKIDDDRAEEAREQNESLKKIAQRMLPPNIIDTKTHNDGVFERRLRELQSS